MMHIKGYLITLAMLLISMTMLGQEHFITGKVKSQEGVALPGATVRVASSQIGTTTDIKGKYKIRLPEDHNVLIFSFVGYKNRRVEVNDKKTINITLEKKSKEINEVVCVGYGGAKAREKLTGSIDHVNSEDLMTHQSAASVDEMIGGMMAGVRIQNSSGNPAEPNKIRIRGRSSLKQVTGNAMVASSQPLIILDEIGRAHV